MRDTSAAAGLFDHYWRAGRFEEARDLLHQTAAACAHEAWWQGRQTALALIATLKSEIGELSRVRRIVRVGGFVNAVDDFKEQPQVMNGCSDLLVAIFGDRGRHARAALGVASLPLGAVVEIEMVVEVD